MVRVAIQGQDGSFHALAARHYFTDSVDFIDCRQFKDVFVSLNKNLVDFAVVAIENSLYGSINEVYDLLLKYDMPICGEIFLRIEHHLLGLPGTEINEVKEIYSQAPALAQCNQYIETHLPQAEKIEYSDTASSAELVARLGDKSKVAIASSAAAGVYGLAKISNNIETDKANFTRFIVLQKTLSQPTTKNNKVSITFATADKPGSLYEVLGIFAKANLNLSKLESRPIIGKAWQYCYYLDFAGDLQDPTTQQALANLHNIATNVRVLGNYQQGQVFHEI